MQKLCIAILSLLAAVGLPYTVLANGGHSPAQADAAWQASYWNNIELAGAPVLNRLEGDIKYDWGFGAPDYLINSDGFSAHWARSISFSAGQYRFSITSDDGARVSVDGQWIINDWSIHSTRTASVERAMTAGDHYIVVEYYEESGSAQIRFNTEPVAAVIRNWRAEYFNNTTLSNSPSLVRDDAQINFNWGSGSPAAGVVNADSFSARWTRALDLPVGWYRFTATTDDGMRLWVNDKLLLDEWRVQSAQTFVAGIYLTGGAVRVRMEYFDNTGSAQVTLAWEQSSSAVQNWRGEYYNNPTLSGGPALGRDDLDVNFNWGLESPAPGVIDNDGFSARWTRTVVMPAGNYRFVVISDDGVRLWVNDRLVIDAWHVQPATTSGGEIQLPEGPATLRLEYFDNDGSAQVSLSWDKAPETIHNWRGEYYNNMNMTGSPVLVRDDAVIDFNWDIGSPAPGVVGIDAFSTRWTRTVDFTPGWYRFRMTVDDGSRLYVNNQLVIDAWKIQTVQQYVADVYLAGPATLKMEYYENGGVASAHLSWDALIAIVKNWRGEYFNNVTLSGPPALVRDDTDINFNWADATPSPAPGVIDEDRFSARWTRTLDLPAGWYRFTTIVDDGGRLFINNQLMIDSWQIQGPSPHDVELYLPGGPVDIRLEFFENNGWAMAQLSWKSIENPTTPQTVIVDDTDGSFVRNAVITDWNTAPEGYGNRLTWTRNSDALRAESNSARWYPTLAPGKYEVFAFIPERYTTTGQASYVVSYAGGRTLKMISQRGNGNRWVSLGTYQFRGTQDDYVELADVTLEPNQAYLVAFDAMKWELR